MTAPGRRASDNSPARVGYARSVVKVLVLFAVVGCTQADDKKPAAAGATGPTAGATAAPPAGATAAADPWGGSGAAVPEPAGAADPWQAKPGAAIVEPGGRAPDREPAREAPRPAPQAARPARPSGGASTLAGTYQCQTLRYGIAPNGMRQSMYVASALGAFEIDADGTYRSQSYASKGEGRARAGAGSMVFEGGPYAGYHGETGSNTTGFFIRIGGESPTAPPKPTMQFNDHMCFR